MQVFVMQKSTILIPLSNTVNMGDGFKIKFTDGTNVPVANKIVNININGVTYQRTTDNYGLANLNINLNPSTYTIYIWANSQPGYQAFSQISKTINVISSNNLVQTTLTPLSSVMNMGEQFQVKLTNSATGAALSGKTIAITVNGVTYHKTTNAQGIASLTINLGSNSYKTIVNFGGDTNYKSSTGYKLIHTANTITDLNYQSSDGSLSIYRSVSNYYCAYADNYIQTLSSRLTSSCTDDLEKSISIHNYVYGMIYTYYLGAKNPALESLLINKGNCVDQTSSLVALCRASNLAVRYVIGDGVNPEDDGHAWGQICINNTWIVSDPTSTQLFGNWNLEQGYYRNYEYSVLI